MPPLGGAGCIPELPSHASASFCSCWSPRPPTQRGGRPRFSRSLLLLALAPHASAAGVCQVTALAEAFAVASPAGEGHGRLGGLGSFNPWHPLDLVPPRDTELYAPDDPTPECACACMCMCSTPTRAIFDVDLSFFFFLTPCMAHPHPGTRAATARTAPGTPRARATAAAPSCGRRRPA